MQSTTDRPEAGSPAGAAERWRIEDLATRVDLSVELRTIGEIAGGFFFHNYAAGSGLMRGATFGRIAGREAATLAVGAANGG